MCRRGDEPYPLELVRLQGKNLIRYQDTYAEQMAAYGLQRGIKGSEAQHISTHEYYRSLITQGEDLQANITQLLTKEAEAREVIAEAEQAKKDLARIKAAIKREQRHACMVFAECEQARLKAKAEAKTEELKNSATKTATSVLNGVNSLLGGNKVSRLKKENTQLHREVDDLNERIDRLHSNEFRRNALANNVTAQVIRDEKRNLFLHINETPIAQWFKEQFGIGQEQTHRRGFRL